MKSPQNQKKRKRPSGPKGKKQKSVTTTLSITSLGRHGHGIAETGERRLYVPYALPGEEVNGRVTSNRGEIIEIIKSSKDRIKPECAHFGRCGGCAVQHLKEEKYREWKREVVVQALRHKGLNGTVEPLVNAHGAGRRRVTLHVRRHGQEIHIGFMQAGSHRLEDIQSCPVLEPGLSETIPLLHELGRRVGVSRKGIDVQATSSETGLDLDIMGVVEPGYDQHMILAELADKHDVARLTLDGIVVSERKKPQVTMGHIRVTLPIGGFLQATAEGENVLADLVCRFAGDVEARSGADLFCGIGPYALRLAMQMPVFAADNSQVSIEGLTNAFRQSKGLKPIVAVTRDLFDNPVSADELNDFDFVVFNPPRAGAEAQASQIAASTVSNVAAVSCDPATFARDARLLVEGGYRMERVVPVDQFRYAAHVEIVGLFTRQ